MSEILKQPGSVLIEEADLVTSDGQTFSIKNFMVEAIIYENMDLNGMVADVTIVDANGMITGAPLLGQETVKLKFRTPTFDTSIQMAFVVYGIKNRVLNNDREQIYTLKCMSAEAYTDTFVRLTSKFVGSTDDIAEKIFEQVAAETPVGKTKITIQDRPHTSQNYESLGV
jgi:hypothetical protein